MYFNWVGLCLLLNNFLIFPPSTLVVIQMPLQVPVFQRELLNKMYGPSIYFYGRFVSNVLLGLFYPLVLITVIFWGLKLEDSSFVNYLRFLLYAVQHNLIGNAIGYFSGILTDDDNSARNINTFLLLFFMLTSGALANVASFPVYIKYLSYVSPSRYAIEGFFRTISRGYQEDLRDAVLE